MRVLAFVVSVAAAGALGAAGAAQASTSDYIARSFDQPASAGLEVQPPLDEFRAVSRART